ncbi:Holliday junction resolvase RuvX [Candidatus Woesebacteria bacterium]|nr:Holliday junction resolvase RuvX [Candidatus Woesebacteria bacterium]
MKILGIDYGRKKMGLAIAIEKLAEPYDVIRIQKAGEATTKIGEIVKKEGVERVVVGISEGAMGAETRSFGKRLSGRLGIKVEFWDETLSTQDSQALSIEAGLSRKKRRGLEDAFAAAVMLQSYLERR